MHPISGLFILTKKINLYMYVYIAYLLLALNNVNDCVVNGSKTGDCNEGTCYAQNAWYSQCLPSCPIGWSCQDPTVNPSNLTLWKQLGQSIYFQKINQTTWIRILFNNIQSFLKVISSNNDNIVLYDNSTYYALNSKNIYTSTSLSTLYNLVKYEGSWVLIYYSAGFGNKLTN